MLSCFYMQYLITVVLIYLLSNHATFKDPHTARFNVHFILLYIINLSSHVMVCSADEFVTALSFNLLHIKIVPNEAMGVPQEKYPSSH